MGKPTTHICTLFEGHYHFGLGALVNSLVHSGYTGTLWVGYRGQLPAWALRHTETEIEEAFSVANRIRMVFVRPDTQVHFTYYKPDFMLNLWESHCPEAEKLLYIDPDIVVKAKWAFFEDWLNHGITLCEDVNSPLSATHPIRLGWHDYFLQKGIRLVGSDNYYVNGGFVGLSKTNKSFLVKWKGIQDVIVDDLPAINHLGVLDRTFIFSKTDQDALNITKDLKTWPLSIADKDAMDFSPGGYILSHAVGSPKPWEKNFLRHLFRSGLRPSSADRLFFRNAEHPIDVFQGRRFTFFGKKTNLALAILLGRLIGK